MRIFISIKLASPEREILWAAEQGDFILIKSLVSKYSNLINVQDADGYTALHRACYSNHLSIVEVDKHKIIDLSF